MFIERESQKIALRSRGAESRRVPYFRDANIALRWSAVIESILESINIRLLRSQVSIRSRRRAIRAFDRFRLKVHNV
jgi:hypothetical protein